MEGGGGRGLTEREREREREGGREVTSFSLCHDCLLCYAISPVAKTI